MPSLLQPEISYVPIEELHFDLSNPRYGPDAPAQETDQEALNYIVGRFDMRDVLNSIAVNGYFVTEPLIGVRETANSIRVMEGNRRFAACLILAKDQRASGQKKLQQRYILADGISLAELPVNIHPKEAKKLLLPYLGVKHIVGGRPWDSYAKAAWVAKMIDDSNLSLSDLKSMLGDGTDITDRLVLSYHLIDQLRRAELFDPADSAKKGRGSAAFPFSLVYNMIDKGSIRKWLEIPDKIGPDPLPEHKKQDGADMVKLICGSLSEDRPPALRESRQLGTLANAILDPIAFSRLKQGTPLEAVAKESMPTYQRVLEDLAGAKPLLEDANSALTGDQLSVDQAKKILSPARQVGKLATTVFKLLGEQATSEDPDPELFK